jgi:hypothetical protein
MQLYEMRSLMLQIMSPGTYKSSALNITYLRCHETKNCVKMQFDAKSNPR